MSTRGIVAVGTLRKWRASITIRTAIPLPPSLIFRWHKSFTPSILLPLVDSRPKRCPRAGEVWLAHSFHLQPKE
jgi:hypothetical protein